MIRALAGLLALAAALAAAAAEREPLRIGTVRSASAGPLVIAEAEGYFRDEGLEARLQFLDSDAAVTAAVAAGRLDVGAAGLGPAFYAFAAAHRLLIIASEASDQTGSPMYALLIGRRAHAAGFSDVRALPGRRIGVSDADAGARYGLAAAAARFGVDPRSMTLRPLPTPARELRALAGGQIDAALLPFATAVKATRPGEALLRLSDLAVSQQRVVFTAASTIAARRPLVEKFMEAYQRGTGAYHFNFLQYDDAGDFIPGPRYEAYLALIARKVRIAPRVLAATRTYCDRRGNPDAADIDRQLKFWQDEGKLDRSLTAGQLLDLSFVGEEAGPAGATGNPR